MKNHINKTYNTPCQLKLPLEIEKIIEISDPVYTFCEVLNQIDLKRYLVIKENRTGRKRFDSKTLLKVILFAFMEHGYESYNNMAHVIEKGQKFLFRVKDVNRQDIISGLSLPDEEEFDVTVYVGLTRIQSREAKKTILNF